MRKQVLHKLVHYLYTYYTRFCYCYFDIFIVNEWCKGLVSFLKLYYYIVSVKFVNMKQNKKRLQG